MEEVDGGATSDVGSLVPTRSHSHASPSPSSPTTIPLDGVATENLGSGPNDNVSEQINNNHPHPPAERSKPKSKVAVAATRTTPPPPPPPPPAPITVRLNIALGGPSNYSVNILQLTKDTGQRHPTPPPIRRDSVSSSGDEDEDEDESAVKVTETSTNNPPTKVRRRKKRVDPDNEYYDLNDPFIDDSDLGVDAPTHFAQTKQKGFYVNSGDVTLVLDSTSSALKKPKKKRHLPGFAPAGASASLPFNKDSVATSAPSMSTVDQGPTNQNKSSGSGRTSPMLFGDGTRDSPIALVDDNDHTNQEQGRSPVKRMKMENGEGLHVPLDRPIASDTIQPADSHSMDSKKRKRSSVSDVHVFSPALEKEFRTLQEAIGKEDFTVKSKFPTALRAPLADVALKAVELDEYDDNFFRYLPEIFPYNNFTMKKLVKRLIYDRHQQIINKRMDALLEQLRDLVIAGFNAAQQAHRDDVARWGKQEKKRAARAAEMEGEGGVMGETLTVAVEEAASGTQATKKERDAAPPAQKYRWTDAIKGLVWQLVNLNNELVSMANVIAEYEPDNHQHIVAIFPEGWMTTSAISREMSNMKKKVQLAEQAEQEEEASE
ncbi:hypothetical protein BS47DRAFT_1393255 [Hydnum rufescens UP504]|uniref:Ubinuclein middle domain-containing protein n=1 Tax=Hydnum rufescens UP504 TaxID=1448309 RepID=A0A9P6AXC7_9AGAM|nr:hypothetical protein BS47DRAFT_1393255 [Hydnum rufescens UP504]